MIASVANDIFSLFLWSIAGLVAGGVGVYIIRSVHGEFRDNASTAEDLIENFRDLHSKGELSDGEYRTIKAVLSTQLQNEIKGNDEGG